MSTQNQTTLNYDTADNHFVNKIEMTLEEVQGVIIQKIAHIRKVHLLLGFSEATLATELDKKRVLSKQLYHLEWQDVAEDFIASEIVADMEKKNQVIDELFGKIKSLNEELVEAEKALSSHLSHKRSLNKNNA